MINMKVLFQHLWKCKVGWDDPIEDDLAQKHKEWREQLSVLKSLTLPRCAGAPTSVQLHGFADASQSAYAATVYLRATYTDGSVSSRLVVAKTRVAPLKTVSIPRLELCAGVMLAELLDVTKQALQMPELEIWAWCDSTVALGWLRASPSLFKTFVANRVATASRHVSPEAWLHVPTDANPADCASRGISALELRTHHLWWGGPTWLLQDPVAVPSQPGAAEVNQQLDLEAKPVAVHAVAAVPDTGWQSKFRSFHKLLHVTAYLFRFCRNLKSSVLGEQLNKDPVLSVEELKAAEVVLFKTSQARTYAAEMNRLSSPSPTILQKNSTLRLVHPFLSQEGLLLVGGRLGRASLAQVGQQIYVPGAKKLAREVCQGCLLCKRVAPRSYHQKMGQLPPPRVEISVSFLHTGVDYVGPFLLKTGHPRRPIEVKGYLAVFVCLATKAVHLEVVSSKTTEAFIATLKLFICRRNVPQHIYSDNGSNFVGARNELKELFNFLSLPNTQIAIKEALLEQRIEWHFIPDRGSPLWWYLGSSSQVC